MSKPYRFELKKLNTLRANTNCNYLIKNLICRRGFIVVWGEPKTGKSFIVLDWALHIASGTQYRDFRTKPGPVIYVACEGEAGFAARVQAARKQLDLSEDQDIPFFLLADRVSLVSDVKQLMADIDQQAVKPSLIVLDTLARTLAGVGSENDDATMGKYIAAATALIDHYDCCVVVIHHCGHEGNRPRGHSSLLGAVDALIAVKCNDDKVISTIVQEMKDGPDGAETCSKLCMVDVGLDEDGDAITTCVIEPHNVALSVKDDMAQALKKNSVTDIKVLAALKAALESDGQSPPEGVPVPAGVTRVVATEQWRKRAYDAGITSSSQVRARQQAFHRSQMALMEKGQVGLVGAHCFIPPKSTG